MTNIVVADTPRFTQEQSSPSFILKDGLWLHSRAGCEVDPAEPISQWPECAASAVVRGGRVQPQSRNPDNNPDRPQTGHMAWLGIVIDGEPMLSELSTCPQPGRREAEGKEQTVSTEAREVRYCYHALEIAEADPDNAVTGYSAWQVLCGPITRKQQWVTDRPFPGLKIREDNCLAEDEDALRNAARQSRAIAERMDLIWSARWLRAESGE